MHNIFRYALKFFLLILVVKQQLLYDHSGHRVKRLGTMRINWKQVKLSKLYMTHSTHLETLRNISNIKAFGTYGNVSSSDYLGVILELFGSSTKSVPNGGSSGAT